MRDVSKKTTKKMIPIFVTNQPSVMATADIQQTAAVGTETAKVVITIVAEGDHAQRIGDYVAMDEIVGLSFISISAQPVPNKENS